MSGYPDLDKWVEDQQFDDRYQAETFIEKHSANGVILPQQQKALDWFFGVKEAEDAAAARGEELSESDFEDLSGPDEFVPSAPIGQSSGFTSEESEAATEELGLPPSPKPQPFTDRLGRVYFRGVLGRFASIKKRTVKSSSVSSPPFAL